MLVRRSWARGHEWSLRDGLTVFTICVCIAVTALFCANMLYARKVAVNAARQAAQNLAESLAQQASDAFAVVDGGLLTLCERVENEGTGPAARDRLQDAIAALLVTIPRLHDVFVIGRDGRLLGSSVASANGPKIH